MLPKCHLWLMATLCSMNSDKVKTLVCIYYNQYQWHFYKLKLSVAFCNWNDLLGAFLLGLDIRYNNKTRPIAMLSRHNSCFSCRQHHKSRCEGLGSSHISCCHNLDTVNKNTDLLQWCSSGNHTPGCTQLYKIPHHQAFFLLLLWVVHAPHQLSM